MNIETVNGFDIGRFISQLISLVFMVALIFYVRLFFRKR